MKSFLHKKTFIICWALLFMMCAVPAFSHGNDNDFSSGNDTKTVRCFPSPATTYINFDFSKNYSGSYIEIFSFSGKKMTEIALTSNNRITITLDNYFRGLYFYRLRDNIGQVIETGKFQVIK
ncbi:MAG: T9SS type A sorting domain-containing protein [Chitinophagaceae bacterium]|nr:T9SS type A sorting domain-containing protein [Chitinophagaceae bacterium]